MIAINGLPGTMIVCEEEVSKGYYELIIDSPDGGRPLREFDPADEADGHADRDPQMFDLLWFPNENKLPYVVKYVEAPAGSEFTIKITKAGQFRQQGHHLACRVYIDGTRNRDGFIEITNILTGDRTIGYKEHRFCFAKLGVVITAENKDLAVQNNMLKDLGVIKIEVYNMGCCTRDRSGLPMAVPAGAPMKVSEAVVKCTGVDCVTRYVTRNFTGKVSEIPTNVFNDRLQRPLAVFELWYRTKDGLMRERIVSRPTTESYQTRQDTKGLAAKTGYKERARQDGRTEIDLTED
ncbi:hypothetical protein VTJ49DRAFT_2550 [Mycothermus thermophilus]|uniref:DUF7918 domain-containing protein n=1 Tax=Humicola insolens TaxID=85995 RepID=A0ABR3VA30_HUMIN